MQKAECRNAECPSPDPILMFNNPNSRAGDFARPAYFLWKESKQRNFVRNCVSPLLFLLVRKTARPIDIRRGQAPALQVAETSGTGGHMEPPLQKIRNMPLICHILWLCHLPLGKSLWTGGASPSPTGFKKALMVWGGKPFGAPARICTGSVG